METGGLWGYIDQAGKIALKPVYQAAAHLAEGVAPVKIGAVFGYIDRSGEVVIQPQFEEARFFYNIRASRRSEKAANGATSIAVGCL
jgi:hypothetical protein